jgi:hypothetical protein
MRFLRQRFDQLPRWEWLMMNRNWTRRRQGRTVTTNKRRCNGRRWSTEAETDARHSEPPVDRGTGGWNKMTPALTIPARPETPFLFYWYAGGRRMATMPERWMSATITGRRWKEIKLQAPFCAVIWVNVKIFQECFKFGLSRSGDGMKRIILGAA